MPYLRDVTTPDSPIGIYLAYTGTGLGDVKMFENMSISDFVAV